MFWKTATDEELRRVCGYISDDKYIASVYGVPRAYVARIRKRLKSETEVAEKRAEREKRNPPISADNYERTSRQGAVDGCAMLLEAIRKHHPERLQLIVAKTNGLR